MKTILSLVLLTLSLTLTISVWAASPTATPTPATLPLSALQSPGPTPGPTPFACQMCVQDLTAGYPKSCASSTVLPVPVGHILQFTHVGLGSDTITLSDCSGRSGSPYQSVYSNVPDVGNGIVDKAGTTCFSVTTAGCAANMIEVLGY